MKVFAGTSVVKVVSFADSRPSASFATACTAYLVEAARCRSGVQLAPSAAISPSTSLPLGSETFTVVSLPCVAPIFSAPLVATDSAPSSGAMATTACEAAVSLFFALPAYPFPSPAPASPPPHAVTSNSSAPRTRARSPGPCRFPLAPADAPDIGCPFTVVVSPRTARLPPWPAPPRAEHARRRKIITSRAG